MYPPSDKDLDRMSREAADQNDVDQSPSGWEHLEKRLDKELPQQKDRRRFLWIFFAFIALSGAGLWLTLANSGEKTKTAVANTEQLQPTPGGKNNIDAAETTTSATQPKDNGATNTDGQPKTQGSDNTVNKLQQQVDEVEKANKSTPQIRPGTSSSVSASIIKQQKTAPRSFRKNPSTATYKKADDDVPVLPVIAGNDNPPKNVNAGKEISSGDQVTNESSPEKSQNIEADLRSFRSKPFAYADSRITKEKKINSSSKAKTPLANRWTFMALGGMDYSRINGTGNNKPGYILGGQVSFDLSKRWSFNTGFAVTRKNYSAQGNDFKKPNGSWLNYVDLKGIDGDCNMWEIPLNVRYNITTNPRLKFFATTGINSYIMRKQAYTYDYLYNGVPTTRDWETSSQHNDWFKILNLSFGIEKAINESWSIQAEPYARVPLKGVGYGEMDISSYGVSVGIKYRPIFKKPQTTAGAKNP
jgi:opacity protein-like surface antigen